MINGISRVLFTIKASLRYKPFDMNNVDPMWSDPITMKNRIETFLMF